MTLLSTIESPLTVFEPAYAQRALLAILLIALLAAAIGSLVVLRDLPFFTHAVGAGTYPFLVVAIAAGVSLPVGALTGAVVFALIITLITGRSDDAGRRDALTGIAIVFALALGSVIAAAVVESDPRLALSPESLLFGSVLTAASSVLLTAAIVATLVVPLALALSGRWLATGFDPQLASKLNARRYDWLLLGAVALSAAAALPITGSLLAGALLVIPAATVRVIVDRFVLLAPTTFVLAITEGVLGLYIAIVLDLPPGATIAAVAAIGFALIAFGRGFADRMRRQRSPRARIATTMLAAAVVAALVSGCGSADSDSSEGDPKTVRVVATTPQVADIVSEVGGDAVSVETLMPVGTDPHDFEPKPSDIAELADADVIVRSGGEIDEWVVKAAKTAGYTGAPLNLANSVKLIPTDGDEHGHEHGDEHGDEEPNHDESFNAHWYLAPANVVAAANKTRDELVKAAPDARESTRANAEAYTKEIEQLNQSLGECVRKVPANRRVFVSGHDDFAYLADAFDFEVAAQVAASGQSEPSARAVQQSVDQARDAGARAVVTSNGETTQLSEQFAEKLDVPLLELYADSLAANGQPSTLAGAIEYNVDRLVVAVSDGEAKCGAGN